MRSLWVLVLLGFVGYVGGYLCISNEQIKQEIRKTIESYKKNMEKTDMFKISIGLLTHSCNLVNVQINSISLEEVSGKAVTYMVSINLIATLTVPGIGAKTTVFIHASYEFKISKKGDTMACEPYPETLRVNVSVSDVPALLKPLVNNIVTLLVKALKDMFISILYIVSALLQKILGNINQSFMVGENEYRYHIIDVKSDGKRIIVNLGVSGHNLPPTSLSNVTNPQIYPGEGIVSFLSSTTIEQLLGLMTTEYRKKLNTWEAKFYGALTDLTMTLVANGPAACSFSETRATVSLTMQVNVSSSSGTQYAAKLDVTVAAQVKTTGKYIGIYLKAMRSAVLIETMVDRSGNSINISTLLEGHLNADIQSAVNLMNCQTKNMFPAPMTSLPGSSSPCTYLKNTARCAQPLQHLPPAN